MKYMLGVVQYGEKEFRIGYIGKFRDCWKGLL